MRPATRLLPVAALYRRCGLCFRFALAALLHELGDNAGLSGLMAGADA